MVVATIYRELALSCYFESQDYGLSAFPGASQVTDYSGSDPRKDRTVNSRFHNLKRAITVFAVSGMVATAGIIAGATDAHASLAMIANGEVNLRAKADVNADSITTIPNGDKVIAYGKVDANGWQKVSYQNKTGFVAASNLKSSIQAVPQKLNPATTHTVIQDTLLRSGPGTNFEALKTLKKDEEVKTTGRVSQNYAEVENGKDFAWLDKSKLSLEATDARKPEAAPTTNTTAQPSNTAKPTESVKPATPTPSAKPTETPAPKPAEKPKVETEKITTTKPGTYRTTDYLNVRYRPSPDSEKKTVIPTGTVVETTGRVSGIYSEIKFMGSTFWVGTEWLAKLDSNLPAAFAPANWYTKLSPADQKARAAKAVEFALQQNGKRYVWGATGPDSFDCSGLTYRAWKTAGYTIPRIANDQGQNSGFKRISDSELQPGDLIIENNGGHVVMYIGDGKVIEASSPKVGIRITTLEFRKNRKHYNVRPGA